MLLNGLNDDIQFYLLNTDYADFQHMVDKAIIIENKIKEMEMDDKRKVPFHRQPSRSNVLNMDYVDFQHMVDKTIVIENKIKEMEMDGKRKVPFDGQPSRSNVMPRFSQPNQFFKPSQMNRPQMPMQVLCF
jgi:hypothetical protein